MVWKFHRALSLVMGRSLWGLCRLLMEFFGFRVAIRGRVGGYAVLCDISLCLLVSFFGFEMGVVRLLILFVLVLDAMSWIRFLMICVVVCFPLSSDFHFWCLGGCGHLLSLGLLLLVSSFQFVGGVDGLTAAVAMMMVIIAVVLLSSL